MPFSLQQAGNAVHLSKSSILRAIRRGTISAVRDARGNWAIEPAELFRAFPPGTPGTVPGTANDASRYVAEPAAEPVVPRALLEAEQNRAKVLEEVVADLRRRLDLEAEERRRLTMVLADQRVAPPVAPGRRSWWPWSRS
jgi:hypothetical protein